MRTAEEYVNDLDRLGYLLNGFPCEDVARRAIEAIQDDVIQAKDDEREAAVKEAREKALEEAAEHASYVTTGVHNNTHYPFVAKAILTLKEVKPC